MTPAGFNQGGPSGAGFTPGPWVFDDISSNRENDGLGYIYCDGPGTIAHTGDRSFSPEANRANARLIAAAPELYGQLESGQTDLDLLRRAIEENDPKAELLIRVTDLWKRNEAALAKARASEHGK